ncbi:MAG: (d)CMP kinase [Thermoleophilales bacterium]|nr:(d)CMP kinase [Thermoleophilales bacterium]
MEIGFDDGDVLIDGVPVSDEIRTPEVTEAASRVSVHPGVRQAMVAEQRRLIETRKPYVAEGRPSAPWSRPKRSAEGIRRLRPRRFGRSRAAQIGLPSRSQGPAQEDRDRRDSATREICVAALRRR